MSENEQHSPSNVVINDKLQRTIKVWWIVNNQIKNGLLLSPPVIFLNQWIFGTVTGKKLDCVVHFLRLLAVCWPGAQSARDNHALACSFVKYSPI